MSDSDPAPAELTRSLDIALEHLALIERLTCAERMRAHCHVALMFLQLHMDGVQSVPAPKEGAAAQRPPARA